MNQSYRYYGVQYDSTPKSFIRQLAETAIEIGVIFGIVLIAIGLIISAILYFGGNPMSV